MADEKEQPVRIVNEFGINMLPAIWVTLMFIGWHLGRIATALEKMVTK